MEDPVTCSSQLQCTMCFLMALLIDAILAGSLLGIWNDGFSLFYGCYVANTFQNYGFWQPNLNKVQVLKHSAKREPCIAVIFLVQITWISIIYSQKTKAAAFFKNVI